MGHKHILVLDDQPYSIDLSDADHLLFVSMGQTLAEIQSFELMLCITLSAIMKDGEAKADFEESMRTNTSKTLGQIANFVRKHLKDDALGDLLTDVKNKRNFFIHDFLRHYGWGPFMETKKYASAITDMEALRQELREVHDLLGKHVTENNLAKIGYATLSREGELTIIGNSLAD